MSESNAHRRTGDVKPRDDMSHVTQGRNYYDGETHGYQLIYRYMTMRVRRRVGRDQEPETRAIQPWPQITASRNELEPASGDLCATGSCQFCGRALISAVAKQQRFQRGTCGRCVKERGLTMADLRA